MRKSKRMIERRMMTGGKERIKSAYFRKKREERGTEER